MVITEGRGRGGREGCTMKGMATVKREALPER